MKKILFLSLWMFLPLFAIGQLTPLSTILTWYETGDRPTQEQFWTSWRNSYNAVSDGMWDLTGYPSIGFTPYSTMQVGKFFQNASYPSDTSIALGFNGILKVSKLYVDGNLISAGGSSLWDLSGNEISPLSTLYTLAIGASSSAGYNLYVQGTTMSTTSVRTSAFQLFNTLGDDGAISLNSSGEMQFVDENNTTPITLSELAGTSKWTYTLGTIHPATLTDSVSVGDGAADSLFNVYGTSYFELPAYFDSTVYVSGVLATSRYLQTPSVNFSYGGNSGRIDLYNAAGKMTFYDSDFPTGRTLSQMVEGWTLSGTNLYPTSTLTNVSIGTTSSSAYKLNVVGSMAVSGTANLNGGVNIPNAQRLMWPLSGMYESGGALRLYDPIVGTVTLSQLVNPLTTYMDSLSLSRLNVDTTYFNGDVSKSLYSPHTDIIYMKNQNALFSFEYFNPMAVFGLGALRFEPANDSLKIVAGWEEMGKLILNDTDTTFQYATGKTGEWRTLASEEWVSATLSGLGGLNLSLDTLYFNSNVDYLTGGGSHAVHFATTEPGGQTLQIFTGSSPGFIGNGNSILFGDDYLVLNYGAGNIYYDATYLRTVADTFATQAYARSFGGGGGGGGSIDLYLDPAPDSIVTVYGASGGLGYFLTNLFNSSYSFITGYPGTADSVKMGRKVQMTNNYTSETAVKYSHKDFLSYSGGYINSYSQLYTNYTDANANSGNIYGLYSHLYADENYAAAANTSNTSAGRFITQNLGTTTIGGGSPGTLYMNGVYGEVTGTINADGTPGTYVLAAIHGKNSNAGNATGYAGYFEGNVNVLGSLVNNNTFTFGDGGETGSINTSDWGITTTGVMTGISGITNNAAITSTGGIVSLNASSNFAINLGTGTSTGAVSIGGGSNTVAVNSTSWDITTAGAVSGLTTLSMSGQLTSSLATGTSPLNVTSTTVNTNFNADLLDGQTGSYYQTATNITAGTLPGDRGVTAGSATSSFVEYNGTTLTAGQFYGGTSLPTGTTRLNYGGYMYDTRHYSDRYYSNALSAITDTMSAVWYPGGYLDSAQFTISASKGWEDKLVPFDEFYAKSAELKALPLPYPDGRERRKMNAMFMPYQVEYTLETVVRYMKEERDKNKILEAKVYSLEKELGIKSERPPRKQRR